MTSPNELAAEQRIRVVLCTVPPAEAERLATWLVETKRAACVNIVPAVHSIYTWEGKLQNDTESLMIIKTTAERYARFEADLKKEHPNSVPEIVAIAPEAVEEEYAKWVVGSTSIH